MHTLAPQANLSALTLSFFPAAPGAAGKITAARGQATAKGASHNAPAFPDLLQELVDSGDADPSPQENEDGPGRPAWLFPDTTLPAIPVPVVLPLLAAAPEIAAEPEPASPATGDLAAKEPAPSKTAAAPSTPPVAAPTALPVSKTETAPSTPQVAAPTALPVSKTETAPSTPQVAAPTALPVSKTETAPSTPPVAAPTALPVSKTETPDPPRPQPAGDAELSLPKTETPTPAITVQKPEAIPAPPQPPTAHVEARTQLPAPATEQAAQRESATPAVESPVTPTAQPADPGDPQTKVGDPTAPPKSSAGATRTAASKAIPGSRKEGPQKTVNRLAKPKGSEARPPAFESWPVRTKVASTVETSPSAATALPTPSQPALGGPPSPLPLAAPTVTQSQAQAKAIPVPAVETGSVRPAPVQTKAPAVAPKAALAKVRPQSDVISGEPSTAPAVDVAPVTVVAPDSAPHANAEIRKATAGAPVTRSQTTTTPVATPDPAPTTPEARPNDRTKGEAPIPTAAGNAIKTSMKLAAVPLSAPGGQIVEKPANLAFTARLQPVEASNDDQPLTQPKTLEAVTPAEQAETPMIATPTVEPNELPPAANAQPAPLEHKVETSSASTPEPKSEWDGPAPLPQPAEDSRPVAPQASAEENPAPPAAPRTQPERATSPDRMLTKPSPECVPSTSTRSTEPPATPAPPEPPSTVSQSPTLIADPLAPGTPVLAPAGRRATSPANLAVSETDEPSPDAASTPDAPRPVQSSREAQMDARSDRERKAPQDDAPESSTADVPRAAVRAVPVQEASPAGEAASTRRPASPDAPAAASTRPDGPAEPVKTPAAHDIRLQVGVDGDHKVEVHVSERGGDVHVAVRTPDTRLAGELRQDLPSLAGRLEQSGFRTETWHPGTGEHPRQADPAAATTPQDGQNQSPGDRQQPRDQQEQKQKQEAQDQGERAAHQQKGKDFEWLLSSLQ